jgi:hypothetical protein
LLQTLKNAKSVLCKRSQCINENNETENNFLHTNEFFRNYSFKGELENTVEQKPLTCTPELKTIWNTEN